MNEGVKPVTTAIPHAPLTVQRFADTGQPEPRHVFEMARKHGVRMVDLKFTDLPGTWQHMGLALREPRRGGVRARGSASTAPRSVASRRSTSPTCCCCPIRRPRSSTRSTRRRRCRSSATCSTRSRASPTRATRATSPRRPRSTCARPASRTPAYFGPEAEFYVFDHVAFDQQANTAFYEVDSEEGHWTSGQGFQRRGEGLGRPRLHEPLAGGLLPGAARTTPSATCARGW